MIADTSITQTIWQWLDAGDFPPNRAAPDGPCWLCGGPTYGIGWRHKDAIAPTFTDYAEAAVLSSESVCQACVALSRSEGWAQYCRTHTKHRFAETFPIKDGKKPRAMNWLYNSHLFTPNHHECPHRARWRELLQYPPPPPFIAIVAISGKKQLIFRARLSESSESFWVRMDDDVLLVEPQRFGEILIDIESLYALGFSKESIRTGDYSPAQLVKVDLKTWRAMDLAMQKWRQQEPQLLSLAVWCAQKPEEAESAEDSPAPMTSETLPDDEDAAPKGAYQYDLFL